MHDFITLARNPCENVGSVSAVVEDVRVTEKGSVNEPSIPMSVSAESILPETILVEKENVSVSEVVLSKKERILCLMKKCQLNLLIKLSLKPLLPLPIYLSLVIWISGFSS